MKIWEYIKRNILVQFVFFHLSLSILFSLIIVFLQEFELIYFIYYLFFILFINVFTHYLLFIVLKSKMNIYFLKSDIHNKINLKDYVGFFYWELPFTEGFYLQIDPEEMKSKTTHFIKHFPDESLKEKSNQNLQKYFFWLYLLNIVIIIELLISFLLKLFKIYTHYKEAKQSYTTFFYIIKKMIIEQIN